MGRILAIDYGKKRTGLAATDPLKIIATPLDTVPTESLIPFLEHYVKTEQVEKIVVGMPRKFDNTETHATKGAVKLIERLKKKFPQIQVFEEDEKFTSKIAMQAMIEGGMKKKDRRKKENVDKVSATLILQSFMESKL